MNGLFKTISPVKVAMFLVVMSAVLMIGICYYKEMEKNKAMRENIIQLNQKIQKEEALEKELRATINALRNDPKTVERLLRENGYARPGETVFNFKSPPQR